MSDTNQAQADLPEDQMTVVDPLEDAANDTHEGLKELADYENEVYSALETPAPTEDSQPEQGERPAPDDDDSWGSGEVEAPAAQPEEQSEGEVGEGSEEEENQPEEDDEQPQSNRYRIRAKDELEAETLSLRKRHPDWSIEDCLNKAKSILGVTDQKPEESTQDEPSQTENVESISQRIKELVAKKAEAMNALEFETASELDVQLEDLRDQRESLRIYEVQAKAAQEQSQIQAYDQAYSESERKAVLFYPDAAVANSALVKRMVEIDTFMRENGDPIYHSTDKPLTVAKMAAADLGIPMAQPAVQTSKPKPSTSKSPVQPASGNARTTTTNAPAPKLDDSLSRVESLEDYDNLVASLT